MVEQSVEDTSQAQSLHIYVSEHQVSFKPYHNGISPHKPEQEIKPPELLHTQVEEQVGRVLSQFQLAEQLAIGLQSASLTHPGTHSLFVSHTSAPLQSDVVLHSTHTPVIPPFPSSSGTVPLIH